MLAPQIKAVAWPPLIWGAASPQWLDQFKGTRIADITKVWNWRPFHLSVARGKWLGDHE